MVFWAQSPTRDHIRAEEDFHTELNSWKDQQARDKTGKTEWKKRRVVGRIYEMKYSWKGHKDRHRHKNRMKRNGQARLDYVFVTETVTSPLREREPARTVATTNLKKKDNNNKNKFEEEGTEHKHNHRNSNKLEEEEQNNNNNNTDDQQNDNRNNTQH